MSATPAEQSGTSGRADAEDAHLSESLAGLARLTTSQISLPAMLTHVAEFAVRAIPGATARD